MSLRFTILGCGSSGGVPRIGNDWGACDPAEPRNRRRRCSLLIEQHASEATTRVLVDTSPDLREQLLSTNVATLDGVVFTHAHADHTHGIDELRVVAINQRGRVPVWADEATFAALKDRFGYAFETPPGSGYPPILTRHPIHPGRAFDIAGHGGRLTLLATEVDHGGHGALGLRVGNVGYVPDIKDFPPASQEVFANLGTLIIDALRRAPHETHLSLAESLLWIERLRPRRAVLTNMHVDLDYATLLAELPPKVVPAYDGMVIEG